MNWLAKFLVDKVIGAISVAPEPTKRAKVGRHFNAKKLTAKRCSASADREKEANEQLMPIWPVESSAERQYCREWLIAECQGAGLQTL